MPAGKDEGELLAAYLAGSLQHTVCQREGELLAGKGDTLKKFMADRKNPALLGAAVLILFLFVLILVEHSRSVNARLVTVGNEAITRQDLLNRLKILGANDVLTQMVIDNMMVTYARQQNIAATPDELRQFDRLYEIRAAAGDKSLAEYINGLGVTMEQWRNFNSEQILYTKLIVPEDDIKAALSRNAEQFTFPAWYRYRHFLFPGENEANQAYDLLQKPDGVAKASALSVPDPAPRPDGVRYYVDMGSASATGDPEINTLKSLKTGQASRPFQMATPDGMKLWMIVLAMDVHPQEKPTLLNCGMLVGKQMMSNDPTYMQRAQQLRVEAFNKIDVKFASTEFKSAYDTVTEMKNQSIKVPGPTGSPIPGLPGTGPAGAGPQSPPPPGPPPPGPPPPGPKPSGPPSSGATPPAGGRK